MLLNEFTLQGPEMQMDLSALQRSVLLLEVSTLQGPELHLDVSALQRRVSNPQGPVHTYCRTCSLRFVNNFLIIEPVRFTSKIVFFLAYVFASLQNQFSFYLMCSLRFENNFLLTDVFAFALKTVVLLSNMFALLRK